MTPTCLSVDQAAERLNVSRPFMYKLFKTGQLRFFKIGRRTLISAADLENFIKEKIEAANPAAQGSA
jgi:excisionase family DNA binding protein